MPGLFLSGCLQSPPLRGPGWGGERLPAQGHLSPEHVTDPQHVMLPGTLPVPGHSGHRLQPHEAPRTLQPTVVTSHHLTFVQHWVHPKGAESPEGRGGWGGWGGRQGQDRWAGDRQRQQEWGGSRETEKGTEKVRDPVVPQHRSETPSDPTYCPSHKSLLKLFDAFLFQTEPQELQYKPRLRLALEKDFQGAGQQGH